MARQITRAMKQMGRVASLVVLAALGTILLMRFSPGYFADEHELDPGYGETARARLEVQEGAQRSVMALTAGVFRGWVRGDFGRSKQFDVPVTELVGPRVKVTAKLLSAGVAGGWLIATMIALTAGLRRSSAGESVLTVMTVVLLAVPVGALATVFLVAGCGGPVAVLALLIAVRDFKFVYKLVRSSRMGGHLLFARAQGVGPARIVFVYLLPPLVRELLAIGVVSIVTALSAVVPVEVLFDVPGLGQLAWSAAMNRDLPVLLTVTLMMACSVGVVTALENSDRREVAL